MNMSAAAAYEHEMKLWLLDHGVRYFSARELAPVGRTAKNRAGETAVLTAPPTEWWLRMLPTLRAADWLREATGTPLTITSAWRDVEYNRIIGGAQNSQHAQFRALDIVSMTHSPDEMASLLEHYPEAHTLGIGIYPGKNFLHVDSRGTRVRWRS